MKLLIDRDPFLEVLGLAAGVIDAKAGVPILRNVLLDTWAKAIRLTATDNDLQLALSCPAEISEQGQITFGGKLLHEIVRKGAKGGQFALAMKKNRAAGTVLQLATGAAKFTLATLPPDDFPSLQLDAANFCEFRLECRQLRAMIEKTQFALSRDETRYYLGGIFLHRLDETLAAVTTDGHRLALKTVPLPPGAAGLPIQRSGDTAPRAKSDAGGGLPGVIIPRDAAIAMLKILPDSEVECELAITTTMIRLTVGETELISKLIDAAFPDWQRVMPGAPKGTAVLPLEAMAEAVARVSTVLDEKDHSIALDFKADRLRISAGSRIAGHSAEETIEDCNCNAPPCRIGVNARYLGDILAALDGGQIIIGLQDAPGAALTFEEVDGDGSFKTILMPMALNEAVANMPKEKAA